MTTVSYIISEIFMLGVRAYNKAHASHLLTQVGVEIFVNVLQFQTCVLAPPDSRFHRLQGVETL